MFVIFKGSSMSKIFRVDAISKRKVGEYCELFEEWVTQLGGQFHNQERTIALNQREPNFFTCATANGF